MVTTPITPNVCIFPLLEIILLNKVTPLNPTQALPDIATDQTAQVAGKLDRVGMSAIEMPIRLQQTDGTITQTPARITAFVNLTEPNTQGIHMSRLYLHLDEILGQKTITPDTLELLVKRFLESHSGLSSSAYLRIEFDYLIRRQALISDNSGWRRYPICLTTTLDGCGLKHELALQLIYSSTCPCSAALARQLIQENFLADFSEQLSVSRDEMFTWLGQQSSINATPHSQRSAADVRICLQEGLHEYPLIEMIDHLENALQTPVQAAVKREDEQAFARLNGNNPMFCEDAGRRIKAALESDDAIVDYWACCQHFESLHPHDAVSVVTKGIEGGYQPTTHAFFQS